MWCLQAVLAESEALQHQMRDSLSTAAPGSHDPSSSTSAAAAHDHSASRNQQASASTSAATAATCLWVDKYAPRGFMSLLSEELVNRQVARWMNRQKLGTQAAAAVASTAEGVAGFSGRAADRQPFSNRYDRKRKMYDAQGGGTAPGGDDGGEAPVLLINGPPGERLLHQQQEQ